MSDDEVIVRLNDLLMAWSEAYESCRPNDMQRIREQIIELIRGSDDREV